MADPSFDEIVEPLTVDETRAQIYALLSRVGVDTTSWLTGSVVRTIVAVMSVMLVALHRFASLLAKAAFLDFATDEWLDLVAWYVYGLTRTPATPASGSYRLTNSGGGSYVVGAGELIVGNPTTGKTYRNSSGFTLSGNTVLTIQIEAVELGPASSSAANAITELVTPLLGVTGTNPGSIVGAEAESDLALRNRCKGYAATLSPAGPADAYTYWALTTRLPNGSPTGVTRAKVTSNSEAAAVSLVIASASGGVSSDALAAVTDTIHRKVAPLGVNVEVSMAVGATTPISAIVYILTSSGMSSAEVQEQARAALLAFEPTIPIGGYVTIPGVGVSGKLYRDHLARVIGSISPDIYRVAITTPADDITVSPLSVVDFSTITISVIEAEP